MHDNSMKLMKDFIEKYNVRTGTILDIGSLNLNGSYRALFPNAKYIGVDIQAGKNVDVIMDSKEWKEIKDADFVISGQTLEHVADIPGLIKSVYNAVVPDGIVCFIAPSSGPPHDYPVWVGHFSCEKTRDLFEAGGFETIECTVSEVLPFKDVRYIGRKPHQKSLFRGKDKRRIED